MSEPHNPVIEDYRKTLAALHRLRRKYIKKWDLKMVRVLDEEIDLEWARIPHFYYNYYVFQYATGYSAAIALSRKILAEGEPAVKDYLSFLSGGCSRSPIELLKGAGVDMTSPEPINQALKLFDELLDEMEELTKDL